MRLRDICKFWLAISFLVFGLPMFFYAQANAESFAAVDFRAGHHKHQSHLCHSGGMSNNVTWQSELQLGVAQSDFRYYMYYRSARCFSDGKVRDRDRSRFVQRVDEELGLAIRWEVQW